MVLDVAEMWRTCVRRGGRLQDVEQNAEQGVKTSNRIEQQWKSMKIISRIQVRGRK